MSFSPSYSPRGLRRSATTNSAFILVAIVAILLGVSGCSHNYEPVSVVDGYDYSGGCRHNLPNYVETSSRMTSRLNPNVDYALEYRVADRSEEIFSDHVPESRSRFKARLIDRLSKLPDVTGTRPASFWTTIAARLKDEKRLTVIYLYSDGDDDSPAGLAKRESERQITEAAGILAANPNILSVTIEGINPENRSTLEREFSQFGPGRFHTLDRKELSLDPMMSELENSRRPANR